MKKKWISVILLLLFSVQYILPNSPGQIPEIPARIDWYPGEYFLVRLPFTLGTPFDFGFGISDQSPVVGVFLFGERSRRERMLLLDQLREQSRIRIFLGVGSELYYEVDWQYYFFEAVDYSNLVNTLLGTESLYIGLTRFQNHARFFGKGSNPRFINESMLDLNMGGLRVQMDSFTQTSLHHFESLTEIGIRYMEYEPFGIVLGELWGAFGNISIGSRASRHEPRFVIGWMPDQSHLGFGFSFHDTPQTEFGPLTISGAVFLGFDGGGYWNVRGELSLTNQNAFIFSISSKSFYMGGRLIVPLGFPQ
jgi:hypothetical protein